ncbi:MAG: class I SAM-dependent methyltransferase [Pseudonocardiaceae bacterium]
MMSALRSGFKVNVDRLSRAQVPERRTRDDVVAAQYDPPDAAAGYGDSHEGVGPAARFFRSRIYLISQTLASCRGGDLLDVGCGPGMMVRELLDSRPGDFRITALDRSSAMVNACALRAAGAHDFHALIGRVEQMEFPDASFDVVLAMGVLEYVDVAEALAEISRVTRPDGLILVTMLNPLSPYRFVEWHVYWRLLRVLRAVEALLTVPLDMRHDAGPTGMRAYSQGALRKMMTDAGLRVVDVAYFDVTLLVPPIDRIVRRWARGWQKRPERTISRRWRRALGTGYMIVGRNAPAPDATSGRPHRNQPAQH